MLPSKIKGLFNKKILNKLEINEEEALFLLSLDNIDMRKLKDKNLIYKNSISKSKYSQSSLFLNESKRIFISDKDNIRKLEDYIILAKKLAEIYPEGKKEGTKYYWRGNANENAKRLQSLEEKFDIKNLFSDNQYIEATTKYLNDYRLNGKYRQILKYFIIKKDDEGFSSTLLDYLSNLNSTDSNEGNITADETEGFSFTLLNFKDGDN